MKEYELTVLIHPDLESKLDETLEKVKKIITSNKGNVVAEDVWGKKRLAYSIKKEDFAVYVQLMLELDPSTVNKIDGVFNITDEILRHLLVAVDPKIKAIKAEEAASTETVEG